MFRKRKAIPHRYRDDQLDAFLSKHDMNYLLFGYTTLRRMPNVSKRIV
jgi:hypothetical protein